LVLAYQDLVYRHACWILHDETAAEDAAQEVFIRVYQNLSSCRGMTFKAWVLRITTNYCLDMLRWQKKHPSLPLTPVDDDGDENETLPWMAAPGFSAQETMENHDLERAIQSCLERLHPDYRTAILLVDVQELDYAEAAQVMGVRLGTLKSRVSRARQRLQQALQGYRDVLPEPYRSAAPLAG
jgi:RNA polymerase sigma-70 factor, ECF subfamily